MGATESGGKTSESHGKRCCTWDPKFQFFLTYCKQLAEHVKKDTSKVRGVEVSKEWDHFFSLSFSLCCRSFPLSLASRVATSTPCKNSSEPIRTHHFMSCCFPLFWGVGRVGKGNQKEKHFFLFVFWASVSPTLTIDVASSTHGPVSL